MKTHPRAITACLVAALSGGLAIAEESGRAPDAPQDPADSVAARAAGQFGFALYQELSKDNPRENLFFSPYSVFGVLSIAIEGAREETAQEMGSVMGFPNALRRGGEGAAAIPWETASIHRSMAALHRSLTSTKDDPAARETRTRIEALRQEFEAAKLETKELTKKRDWDGQAASARKEQKVAEELNRLLAGIDQYQIRVANALWGEKSYPFRKEFLQTIARHYGTGGAFMVDFRNAFEAARRQINGWADGQTRGRIQDLIPDGGVNDLTRLVLTNAVYFKGEWATPFKEGETSDRDFTLAGGQVKQVPIMLARALETARYGAFNPDGSFFPTPARIRFGQEAKGFYPGPDGFAMVELPYKGDALSMVVAAPNDPQRLPALEQKLTPELLTACLGNLARRATHVYLPKFKLETEYTLGDAEKPGPLQRMGMVRAFTDPRDPVRGAQFGGMTTSTDPMEQLSITKVFHKAFVEVNEKGTEAAAATAAVMAVPASMPVDQPFTPEFKADRPFLFLIRETSSGGILFLGRVSDPSS